jgi:hypothetical protein
VKEGIQAAGGSAKQKSSKAMQQAEQRSQPGKPY